MAAARRFSALIGVVTCCLGATAATAAATASNSQGSNLSRHRGGVVAWGDNTFGELGVGSTNGPQFCLTGVCSAVPVGVSKLKDVQAVASGDTHGLALIRNGHLWAWGSNANGELGDNSTQQSAVPVRVCAPAPAQMTQTASGCERYLQDAAAVSANEGYSLALLRNGSVVAWGINEYGELGDGSRVGSDVPVAVCAVGETAAPCAHELSGVVAISAGARSALALLQDGTVVAWGDNRDGELGDGGTTASSVPVPVSGLGQVKAIAAGGEFGMALQRDGTVMTWGWLHPSYEGPVYSFTPVAVEGLSAATAIAVGWAFKLALLENGTVESWGSDFNGQLGDEEECVIDIMCRQRPAPIPGLSEVGAISAGGANGLALQKNGTVMAWGQPLEGQIGNDQFLWSGTYHGGVSDGAPTPVCALSEVSGISSGGELSLAYGKDGYGTPCTPEPVLIEDSPQSGPAGTRVTIVGDNLAGATKVTFYRQQVNASFTVVSPTEIVAIAPAAPLEEGRKPRGPISVTTPLGEARTRLDINLSLFESAIPHFVLEETAVEAASLTAPPVSHSVGLGGS